MPTAIVLSTWRDVRFVGVSNDTRHEFVRVSNDQHFSSLPFLGRIIDPIISFCFTIATQYLKNVDFIISINAGKSKYIPSYVVLVIYAFNGIRKDGLDALFSVRAVSIYARRMVGGIRVDLVRSTPKK